MPRSVPTDLQSDLDSGATTLSVLLRIDPVSPGFAAYGVTELNRDVVYDDGISALRYRAAVGMISTSLLESSGLTVDNADTSHLMPEFDVPISEADIRAGVYDFARFALYLVNYEALDHGHVTLKKGTIGRVSIDASGLSFVQELRGLIATLKQSVCEKDSLTCRATYGSQPPGSLLPGPVQRFPCGKDATGELVDGVVTAVGLENTLTFTIGGFALADGALNPGILVFETGLNAGKTYEIDTNSAAGVITLAHETAFPIQIGDALKYRSDCNKQARDEQKGCEAPHHWGDEWPLHFRGEPDIPIGDAEQMEIPGASSAPGLGGFTSHPFQAE